MNKTESEIKNFCYKLNEKTEFIQFIRVNMR